MKKGNVLDGLNVKGNGRLIDADSFPRLVPAESHKPVSPDQRDKMLRREDIKTKAMPTQQSLIDVPAEPKKQQYF